MPSPFSAAMARADAALDTYMGETVQVSPQKAGDFARQPDPNRPAFDVVALVVDGDPSGTNVPRLDARVVHEEWRIEIRRTLLAGRRIAKGDEIILLDRPGSPRITVNMVERLDEHRLGLICGPIAD